MRELDVTKDEVYALYTTDPKKQFQCGPYVAKFDVPIVFTDIASLPVTFEFIESNSDLRIAIEMRDEVVKKIEAKKFQNVREGVIYIGDQPFRITNIRGIVLKRNEVSYEFSSDEIERLTKKDGRFVRVSR